MHIRLFAEFVSTAPLQRIFNILTSTGGELSIVRMWEPDIEFQFCLARGWSYVNQAGRCEPIDFAEVVDLIMDCVTDAVTA